tara:strand:+ start:16083 stop:16307 length:225 start_codon:yes stop_codon:yes gene_type:complete
MAQYRYYKNQIRFNVLADEIAPLMSWPTQIVKMSEILAKHNPNFNRKKFEQRAISAWEKEYQENLPEFDDEIPY